MRQHSPGFYKRLMFLGLQNDVLRAAVALILLIVLFAGGAPFWAALIAPLLVYAGLWLLAPNDDHQTSAGLPQPPRRLRSSDAAAAVCEARAGIASAAQQMTDPENAMKAEAIANWIDRSVDAIKEDGTSDALSPLLELARFTNDLLSRYVKLCRRGLADSSTHAQLKVNLANLEVKFRWFWEQLNREAIIDLEALSAAVELFMNTVPPVTDRGDPDRGLTGNSEPRPLVAEEGTHDTGNAMVHNGNGRDLRREKELLASLTARETETLRLLAAGRTNQQIADALYISRHTVAKHVENVCGKLDVQNRTEAAALAVRNGIT